MPMMMFDFVTSPASRDLVRTLNERSYENPGRMLRNTRGTVSTLWAKTCGRVSST